MKKIFCIIISIMFTLMFVACSGSEEPSQEGSGMVDTLLQDAAKNDGASAPEGEQQTAPNDVNYAPYRSIISAYQRANNGFETIQLNADVVDDYVAVSGATYYNLVDFDGNGVLELVLVRMDIDLETLHDFTESVYYNDNVQIFTIDEMGAPKHLVSTPLMAIGNGGDTYGVQYATVEGKTCLVSGFDLGDYFDKIYYSLDEHGIMFAEMALAGDHEGLAPEYLYKNGALTTQDEFLEAYQIWNTDLTTDVVTGFNLDSPEHEALIANNEEVLEFLSAYPQEDLDNTHFVFRDGLFLVMEDEAETPPEVAVQKFFHSLITNDLDALAEVLSDEIPITHYSDAGDLELPYEDRHFFPGYVIQDIEMLNLEDTVFSMDLYEELVIDIEAFGLENYYIVQAEVNEGLDTDIAPAHAQIAGGTYMYWFLMGVTDDGETYEIYNTYNDKFHWSEQKAFYVAYLGDSAEVVAGEHIPGVTSRIYPISLSYYMPMEEVLGVEYLEAGAAEYYLVQATNDSPLWVYDYSGGVRGELLHATAPGARLFMVTPSNDPAPSVEVVCQSYSGIVQFSYFPSGAPYDGEPEDYDPVVTLMPWYY